MRSLSSRRWRVRCGLGDDPNTGLFRGQLDLDADGYIVTGADSTCTSIEAVFAAGDVQDHVFKQALHGGGKRLHGRDRSRTLVQRSGARRERNPSAGMFATVQRFVYALTGR